MASLVTEILSARGKAEVDDLASKIAFLNARLSDFKNEAGHVLSSRYIHFQSQLNENKTLAATLYDLSDQMTELQTRVEKQTKAELQNSTSELQQLSSELQQMNLKIFIVKQLVILDDELSNASKELTKRNYHRVAEIFYHTLTTLKVVDGNDEAEPEMIKGMRVEATIKSEAFLFDIKKIWNESIICTKHIEGSKPTYMIHCNISNQSSFTELVRALHLYNELESKIRDFSNKFLENIITVLTSNTCTVDVHGTEVSATLYVIVENASLPHPVHAIRKLTEVFEFIQNTFDIVVEEDMTFLNLVGQVAATKFCDIFIKNILQGAIPEDNIQREAYETVIEETSKLQKDLETSGFLSSMNQTIIDYAMNVDVHFNNKLCELTLDRARAIIKQDLHDTVEMLPQVQILTAITNNEQSENLDQSESFASLSTSTLQFPKCLVSKSAVELMELINDTLKKASKSSEMRAVRLFCTARKILEMYCGITPAHHKKFLDTLPQQAALFHNNCLYLAHQLLTLGGEYSNVLAQLLPAQSLTFVDQVSKLRHTGGTVFLAQMQVQRKQLLDILRDSGLSKLGDEDKLPPTTEKCIRQCLRQIELLQRVWQNVLPSHVYNKSIGTMLNTLVEELIVRVCTTEDIPAESATDLASVFTTVLDRAPRVLLEAGEVHQYVKRWRAFEELVQILGANLQTIDNRWANGMGPLAHEFSADQVKALVRALFQNTARRAALLAKIK